MCEWENLWENWKIRDFFGQKLSKNCHFCKIFLKLSSQCPLSFSLNKTLLIFSTWKFFLITLKKVRCFSLLYSRETQQRMLVFHTLNVRVEQLKKGKNFTFYTQILKQKSFFSQKYLTLRNKIRFSWSLLCVGLH